MKRKRYYAIETYSWDCNNHKQIMWNIIDRNVHSLSTKDPRIGQAWSKEAKDLIIKKLNK